MKGIGMRCGVVGWGEMEWDEYVERDREKGQEREGGREDIDEHCGFSPDLY
jgi:hypothetical protein